MMIDLPLLLPDTQPTIAPYAEIAGLDSTPGASVLERWVSDCDEQDVVGGNGTTCFTFYRPFFDRRSWLSDTLLLSSPEHDTRPQAQHAPSPDKTTEARDKRVILLARKYALKDFPEEETARLEILTARLRKMIPRVDAADFEALDKMAQDVKASEDRRRALRRKLGLEP